MPRNYVRKTDKCKYSTEVLNKAINAIKTDGRKIREVGRCFGIPESTLRKYLNARDKDSKRPSLGRKSIFQEEAESELKAHIVLCSNPFYGIGRGELRRLVYEFAEDNGLDYNFNKETRMAGKEWTYCFLKRHPTIKVQNSESSSLNRKTALSEEEVKRFFDNMKTVMRKMKIEPGRIYSQDETEIPTDLKRFGMPSSYENGTKITSVFCMNFEGHYIPPMIIYPVVEIDTNLQNDQTTGAIYRFSTNGRSTSELFLEWLAHFKEHATPTEDNPVLLVLDNHNTHRSTCAHNFCRDNHIYMVPLPPHAYNLLQPLDLSFFGPLNNALYEEYEPHLKLTRQDRISGENVAELLNKAFLKVATKLNAASGFEFSGIVPMNPEKFPRSDFDTSLGLNLPGPAGFPDLESSASDDSTLQEIHAFEHEEHGSSRVME